MISESPGWISELSGWISESPGHKIELGRANPRPYNVQNARRGQSLIRVAQKSVFPKSFVPLPANFF
jgi:hypothetical protein